MSAVTGAKPALPLLLVLLLSACGQDAATALTAAYLTRLQAATGQSAPPLEPPPLHRYPARRDRALPLAETRVGLIEFFGYYDCELFGLVNERNSILGKVMPGSQRLLYELRFLDSAERCLAQQRQAGAEQGALDKLAVIISDKRAHLPAVRWNALFDSEEMQKAMSLAVSPLAPEAATPFTESLAVIDFFTALSRPDAAIPDSATLEAQYEILQRHQYGGRLVQALALATLTLEQAAALLTDRHGCQTDPAALQAYVALLRRQGTAWFTALERLLAAQPVAMPAAFAAYRAQMLGRESVLWRAFERAEHRWQQALTACEPGQQ